MDLFLLIMRIIVIFLASLLGLLYVGFQTYKKIPLESFQVKTVDYIVYAVTSLLFGFGLNNYLGLLVFVPLFLIKVLSYWIVRPEKLQGLGFWIEVSWTKLLPKGFEKHMPKAFFDEMQKIPQSTQLILPRFFVFIALFFIEKQMKKSTKSPVPMKGMPFVDQQQGAQLFTQLIENIRHLKTGHSERKELGVGVLKITRL